MGFRIQILNKPEIEKVDQEFLMNFKFSNQLPFPESYLRFANTFGYGLLMDLFIVYVPMGNFADSWHNRSFEIRNTYITDVIKNDIWFDLAPDGSIELLKRLVPFAISENGHYLFWDIDNGAENEFDIYLTDFRSTGFIKVADSIYDLINKLTSEKDFRKVLPYAVSPLQPIFHCFKTDL